MPRNQRKARSRAKPKSTGRTKQQVRVEARERILREISSVELRERLTSWRGREAEARVEVRRHVQAARDRGWSWTEIGSALGVTRQAARQRFKDVD